MTESTARLPLAAADLLLPCPFCGGEATLEPDPSLPEIVQIACGNGACRVMPRTEYLLESFADELVAAWNGRPSGDPGAGPDRDAPPPLRNGAR